MPVAPPDGALRLGAPLHRARAACVFLHGRGQTPEDMRDQVLARVRLPGIFWLLPRQAGKSWYKARAVDPLTPETEAELGASIAAVAALVQDAAPAGVPLLLGGFSQGACLSLEMVLRGALFPAALVAFTGARVGGPGPTCPLAGLPAYLSGSDADPWIPPAAFADAAGSLAAAGARLRAESHPGRPHQVSDAEIGVLRSMLRRLAPAA